MNVLQEWTIHGKVFFQKLKSDHVGAYAAQSAYFIILSFIPFLILFLTLIQYTSISKADIFTITQKLLPDSLDGFVINIIDEIYQTSGLTLSLSAIMAAWTAGKGILALTCGMNVIYGVQEKRNYVLLRLKSAVYTLLFVIAIILTLLVLVFGNYIHFLVAAHFPLYAAFTSLVVKLNDIISIGFLTFVFMFIYSYLPNRRTKFFMQAPGAVFAAIGWYVFSLGFSLYINISPGINNMYGSLTTIILVMLWLYFCMYIILIGAEINSKKR